MTSATPTIVRAKGGLHHHKLVCTTADPYAANANTLHAYARDYAHHHQAHIFEHTRNPSFPCKRSDVADQPAPPRPYPHHPVTIPIPLREKLNHADSEGKKPQNCLQDNEANLPAGSPHHTPAADNKFYKNDWRQPGIVSAVLRGAGRQMCYDTRGGEVPTRLRAFQCLTRAACARSRTASGSPGGSESPPASATRRASTLACCCSWARRVCGGAAPRRETRCPAPLSPPSA